MTGSKSYGEFCDNEIAFGSQPTHQLSDSTHRDLANGLGFHTYICWASDKGQWNVTAYFSPEIYRQSRPGKSQS